MTKELFFRFNDEYANLFITALGQVPLKSFHFEMGTGTMNRTTWNSVDGHTFRVVKVETFECLSNDDQIEVQDVYSDLKIIVPCFGSPPNLHKLNLAYFIRNDERNQVSKMDLQSMENDA